MTKDNKWKVECNKTENTPASYAVYRKHHPYETDRRSNREYAAVWIDKETAQALADKLNKDDSKEIEAMARIIRPRISLGCNAYYVAGALILAGFGDLKRASNEEIERELAELADQIDVPDKSDVIAKTVAGEKK